MGERSSSKKRSGSTGKQEAHRTRRAKVRVQLVDEPMYCGSCGKQYYVSGDRVSFGKQKKWVYELEPEEGKETYTIEKNLYCPLCFGELYPLKELEELFGEAIRSF